MENRNRLSVEANAPAVLHAIVAAACPPPPAADASPAQAIRWIQS